MLFKAAEQRKDNDEEPRFDLIEKVLTTSIPKITSEYN